MGWRAVRRRWGRRRRAHARPTRRLGAALAWLGLAGLAVVAVARVAGGTAAGQEAVASGERLYQQQCVHCHGTSGEGTVRGPALTGAGAASADFYLRSGRMPIDDPEQEVERSEPRLSDEQIRELVDYVADLGQGLTIPEVDLDGAELTAGGELYRANCVACHNWDGKGGALVGGRNAPPLHEIGPTQVAEAIRIGPGSMPGFDEDVLSDEHLSDVVAYVRYLDDPEDAGGFGLGHWGPATEGVAALVALGALLLVTGWLGTRERR